MNIKSMTATFGTLENAHLELQDGLNLLYAPNEGGKSTWAAFWKAMLYGIDTRDRDKKGYLADKNHYQPWSGHPMEGEVILEWNGRSITLRRSSRGNVPFGQFSAVYTGTEEPVPGLTGENCGEMLTGVSREVFERSALIGSSGNLNINSTPDLERRIAALLSTGQEDVSYSEGYAKLKAWLNHRKVNRTVGIIPKLEEELHRVEEELCACREMDASVVQLEEEEYRLQMQRKELLAERELHTRLAQEKLNQRFAQAEEAYQKANDHLSKLEQEYSRFGVLPEREALKRAQGELQYLKVLDEEIRQAERALEVAEKEHILAQEEAQEPVFSGLTGEQAVQQVAQSRMMYDVALEDAEKKEKQSRITKIALVILTLVSIGLVVLQRTANIPLAVVWAMVGCIGAGAAFFYLTEKKCRDCQQQAEKILTRYNVEQIEELEEKANTYAQRCQKANETAQVVKNVRTTLQDRTARRENSRLELLEFVHRFAPEVHDMFGCSAALSRALGLEHELYLAKERVVDHQRRRDDLAVQGGQPVSDLSYIHPPERTEQQTTQALKQINVELERVQGQRNRASGAQKVMGDRAALEARKEELKRELGRRQEEYQAIGVAMEALTEANATLQDRYSPELNRLTAFYLSRMTGNQYTTVSLNRDLDGFAARQEDLLPHSVLYLSRGTADQVYLSLRLAVCHLCLPEKPPILLDDAFVTFDDQRLALALDVLRELAQEQQILLFTCQQREGQLLKLKN